MLLLSTDSCRKAEDLGSGLQNGDKDLGQCAIQTMTLPLDTGYPPPFLTFAYNSAKDLVSVTMTTGLYSRNFANWLFSYDKKGRLSQYVTVLPSGPIESWDIYFYDGNNRIIGDSTYTGGFSGQRAAAPYQYYTQLYYDHLNRIVKTFQTQGSGSTSFEYTYNAAGNLTSTLLINNHSVPDSFKTDVPGYVNRISVLLTNKIWRFLARDYSVNSRSDATSYNEAGLPTVFSGRNGIDIATLFFGSSPGLGLDIQYDCPDQHTGK